MIYSISEFARITGLSAHTLRYYEKENLLKAARSRGGQRIYLEKDVAWVDFIKRLKETGMPIKEIKIYAEQRALGNKTLKPRLEMLQIHRQHILVKITKWKEHLKNMNHKIKYYEEELNRKSQL